MAAMTPEDLAAVGLRLEIDGPVATVTLDRPEVRNAQTPAMWLALGELGRTLPDEVRVVVVTGEGDTFSAGLDRAMLDPATPGRRASSGCSRSATTRPPPASTTSSRASPGCATRASSRSPRCAGYAIGAGFQLALSCDLRVVADDAKFSMKESALGLVPDLTGTKPLVEHVGYARALEICATARVVAADEAVAHRARHDGGPGRRAGRSRRRAGRRTGRSDGGRRRRDQGTAAGGGRPRPRRAAPPRAGGAGTPLPRGGGRVRGLIRLLPEWNSPGPRDCQGVWTPLVRRADTAHRLAPHGRRVGPRRHRLLD